MIIDKITLYNYRLYKGENIITFNLKKDRNVFLISGENGFGKTTFLHSLLWCLYGRLASDIEDGLKKEVSNGGYNLLLKNNLNHSQRAIIETLDPQIITQVKRNGYTGSNEYVRKCSQYFVEIVFSEVVIPSIPCSNLAIRRGYDIITEKEFIEIFIDGVKNELTNEIGPEIFINDFVLNKDIARFFFFDSEQIVSLAETSLPSERKRLSSAYNEVLGVRKYEDLRNTLNSVRVRFRKRSNDIACRQKIDKLVECRESILTDINNSQILIDNLDIRISSLEKRNDELQLQLIREGNNATTEEIKRLSLLIESCSKKDDDYKVLLRSFLEYAPLAIMGSLLKNTKSLADADYAANSSHAIAVNRNNIISDITSDLFLMIHRLDLDSKLRMDLQDKIQSILQRYRREKSDTKSLLDISDADYKEFCSIYNYITSTYRSEFERLADDYKKNKQVLDRSSRRLSNIQSKESDLLISSIRSQKNEIELSISKLNTELRALIESVGEKKQQLATIQKQLSELLKSIDLDDLDSKKDALAQSLSSELSSFLNLLKAEKKSSLERRIKRILNSLMHKDDFIGKVEVLISDDDMDIILHSKDGNIINKDSLSKGEQQLYASSLLKALVEESGIKFPVFIDSPLQKFDKSHASKIITDFYPSISSQVVLFPLLFKELTPEEYNLMSPIINDCYLIKNDVVSSYFERSDFNQIMSNNNVYTN